MIERFVYQPPPVRIIFGCGAAQAEMLRELDHHRIARFAVLCSRSGARLAHALADNIPGRCLAIIDQFIPDLAHETFNRLLNEVERTKVDGFVVIGGGTPIGIAKAIAARLEIPFVAIVTSYSGSEMSAGWYVGAGAQRIGGNNNTALPATAIYDPQCTLALPPDVSASSGMNAMAHAVESLYAADLSPVVETQALIAVAKLATSLPVIVGEPGNIEARTDALFAAWLAGAFRAESGIEHALAQRVRQAFSLDHARTHAVFLPYAAAFNRPAVPQAMLRISNALGVGEAAQGLYELNVRLGLATGLKDLGMPASGIERAVDAVTGAKFANPRQASRSDILDIVTQAFHGLPPR